MFHVKHPPLVIQNKKGRGYILETIEIIRMYMATFRKLLDSGKLSSEEYNAIEFAHELAEYEFFAEIQKTQDQIDHLKQTGMLN